MTFGQLLPGDAMEAKRELKSTLNKKTTRAVLVANFVAEYFRPVTMKVPEDSADRSLS